MYGLMSRAGPKAVGAVTPGREWGLCGQAEPGPAPQRWPRHRETGPVARTTLPAHHLGDPEGHAEDRLHRRAPEVLLTTRQLQLRGLVPGGAGLACCWEHSSGVISTDSRCSLLPWPSLGPTPPPHWAQTPAPPQTPPATKPETHAPPLMVAPRQPALSSSLANVAVPLVSVSWPCCTGAPQGPAQASPSRSFHGLFLLPGLERRAPLSTYHEGPAGRTGRLLRPREFFRGSRRCPGR